jgi:hypothetical protein
LIEQKIKKMGDFWVKWVLGFVGKKWGKREDLGGRWWFWVVENGWQWWRRWMPEVGWRFLDVREMMDGGGVSGTVRLLENWGEGGM